MFIKLMLENKINDYYKKFLYRDIDEEGKKHYLKCLKDGKKNLINVKKEIMNSKECKSINIKKKKIINLLNIYSLNNDVSSYENKINLLIHKENFDRIIEKIINYDKDNDNDINFYDQLTYILYKKKKYI